jgi:flagellar hook-length control protein FliK
VAGDPQSAAGAEAAQPGQVGPETPVEVGVQRADGTAEPGNAQEPQGTAGTARPEEAAPQREAVLRQVVRAARLNVAEGSTRFELRLDPPSLGKVGVVLDLREGALSVSFKVESDAVRELLQNSMAQLRSSLSSHGVSVAGLDVEGSGSEAVEQQGAQGWSGFDRGAGASGGEEAEGVAGQEPAATGRDRVREGSIEYWA